MLSVEAAVVRFEEREVLRGLDLRVGGEEVVAVLGPSGCGKSTLLRAIAGLEPLAGGRVTWAGVDLAGTPPHRRRFGLMFQDYALFPHRDVRGNVEFGLRMARLGRDERRRRVAEVLELVGLGGLADRRVSRLSGGEQQRVALARALAPSPQLLMLDEPLGSLDRSLRERLLRELGALLRAARVPAVYVTHDHDEAFALGDRLVVMRDGRVVQSGTPPDVWSRPADEWVAGFLGFGRAVDGAVVGERVATPWGDLPAPPRAPAGPARVVLRPGALRVDPAGRLDGRVDQVTFRGDHLLVRVQPGAGPAVEVATTERVAEGDRLRLALDPAGVLVYPRPRG